MKNSVLIVNLVCITLLATGCESQFGTESTSSSSNASSSQGLIETPTTTTLPKTTTTTLKPVTTTTTVKAPVTTTTIPQAVTTTTVKPVVTTTTLASTTTTTIPVSIPAALPANSPGVDAGAPITIQQQSVSVDITALARVTGVSFPANGGTWSQIAGPRPVIMLTNYPPKATIADLVASGVYDFKYEITGDDNILRTAYKRIIVNKGPIIYSKLETPGSASSSGAGEFKSMSLELTKQRQPLTTGTISARETAEPKLMLQEHDGNGGIRSIEVDRNTLDWSVYRAGAGATCSSRAGAGYMSAYKALVMMVTPPTGYYSYILVKVYRDDVSVSNFQGGDIVVDAVGVSMCAHHMEISARLTSATKAVDGSSLGHHADRKISYSLTIAPQ